MRGCGIYAPNFAIRASNVQGSKQTLHENDSFFKRVSGISLTHADGAR